MPDRTRGAQWASSQTVIASRVIANGSHAAAAPLVPPGASLRSRAPGLRHRAVAVLLALLVLAVLVPTAAGSALPGTEPGVLTVGPAAAAPGPRPQHAVVPAAAAVARPKVVVIVGPVGPYTTARYRRMADRLAGIARDHGAAVTKVYSPNATWERVVAAARGANVLIYLGHGNGYPNQYGGDFDPVRQEGFGLNASVGAGNSNARYYGSALVAEQLELAPGATVILNHLCYASGNNEWGRGNPTRSVAMRRADGFATGFLRAGAAAVFADGIDDPAYVLDALFGGASTPRTIFWSSPAATRRHALAFVSRRTSGAGVLMDPYAPNRYYRSVVGQLDRPVSAWGDPSGWPGSAGEPTDGSTVALVAPESSTTSPEPTPAAAPLPTTASEPVPVATSVATADPSPAP